MNAFASLLLITTLTFPTSVLVLRSGKRIHTDGSVAIENGVVTFRNAGALYSVRESDVDLDASRAIVVTPPEQRSESAWKLKVSREERDRLLRDLEQNHSGGTPVVAPMPSTAKSPQLAAQDSPQEWEWKQRAQQYEESVRRAHEELDLLRECVEQLESRVRGLLLQGFKPQQFTYDTSQLEFNREQIPHAELEVRRAEREYATFLDNARRQGILPGWLR
jgi:hypothetical protein